AETLVALDCAVVSGGAAGIDAAAHNAALESGGNTIFIVPADILGYCPAWIEAAISGRALFLSESLPGALWTTHAAVQRNRLIAAMAQAVWVVEPRKEGGSIRTARIAAGLNRPVACYRPPDTFKNVIPWLVFSGPDALSKDTIRGMLEHAGPTQGDLFKPPPT
ncbi:MAG TPA: DNA-processing protein DprA, partial [Candidatus Hydrogenedentes bacterium]|nr:DNA-processing protein DprA [Candidatus Hydrogenedentota bacterium]